jgi:hypothetical protein
VQESICRSCTKNTNEKPHDGREDGQQAKTERKLTKSVGKSRKAKREKNTHTYTVTHLQKRRNLENSQPAAGVVSSLDPEAFFSLPVLHSKCRAETKIAVQKPSRNREGIAKLKQVSCSSKALWFSPSLFLSAYLTSPASATPNLVSDHRLGIPMPKLRYGKKERWLDT